MDRRRFLALAGACAGVGCMGCARNSQPERIRVSAQPLFSMSSLYLAKELGYFDALGLQVEIENVASSVQAIPLAAGGKIDVVFSASSPSLVNAIARGARLRIVAGRDIAAPNCSNHSTLYGRRDVFPDGLQDVRLLKGKRVAAELTASLGSFSVDMILAKAGMTTEELNIVKMRKPEMVVSLLSNKVDAIFISDFAARLEDERFVRGLRLADVLPNHQIAFIIFGARLLDENLEVGVKFLGACLHGAREYFQGKTPKFSDDLAVSNGMDPIAARETCRDNFVLDGRIDLPSLDRFTQWAVAKKLCPVSVQSSQLVDMRFLNGQPRYQRESQL